MTTAPSPHGQERTLRAAPRRRRLSRTVLSGFVRGAATAIRTVLAG
ncbi:hypothetical protein [Streptomyces incarnatus]|nr:hypothetical protein [Streptomyces incarnatus]